MILGNPIRAAKAKGADMPRLQAMYAVSSVKYVELAAEVNTRRPKLLKMAQQRRDEKSKSQQQAGTKGGELAARL